jgi:iron complex outermembrane receptor protein
VQLGRQSHRGAEFSIAGQMATGLNVVAGGVLLHPEISTESPAAPPTGRSAVGLSHNQIQLSVNYQVPAWTGLSADAVLTHYGWSAASLDNRARLPGHTNLDLGIHYRFTMQRCPASLRLQVLNVTDEFSWAVNESGGLTPQARLRVQAYVTVDLIATRT